MIYNRPSMHVDAFANHKHDFCCTYAVQCFLNPIYNYHTMPDGNKIKIGIETYSLDYHVYMRSCDAVFGYCNDYLHHNHVFNKILKDLNEAFNLEIQRGKMIWNAGSLHAYERHFKFLN